MRWRGGDGEPNSYPGLTWPTYPIRKAVLFTGAGTPIPPAPPPPPPRPSEALETVRQTEGLIDPYKGQVVYVLWTPPHVGGVSEKKKPRPMHGVSRWFKPSDTPHA